MHLEKRKSESPGRGCTSENIKTGETYKPYLIGLTILATIDSSEGSWEKVKVCLRVFPKGEFTGGLFLGKGICTTGLSREGEEVWPEYRDKFSDPWRKVVWGYCVTFKLSKHKFFKWELDNYYRVPNTFSTWPSGYTADTNYHYQECYNSY